MGTVDDNHYQYYQQPYMDPEYNGNSQVERGREYVDPESNYGAGMDNSVIGGYNPEMHTWNRVKIATGHWFVHSFIIHYLIT